MIRVERVYDYKKRTRDKKEYLVLVDRLWPRGIRKEDLDVDEWLKDLGPSNTLRKWFAHDSERWDEFTSAYQKELEEDVEKMAALQRLKHISKSQSLTLLYSAKNEAHNQAVALKDFIREQ